MDLAMATIICPTCGYASTETVPTDSCLFFYECRGCSAVLKPKSGDCCVFCSYGDRGCMFRKPEKSK
ncbi:MAG TPA: GDCCVxC domain-containing (seleno)protein [Candidatus Acidoferrales bacterium]|nr:GDCCVxC domain-containing (seleno)protein [Candidatus Acidoferrales bacterium]